VELVEGYRGAWIGLLANPNQLAMVMAVTMPWTLAEALRSRSWRRALLLGALASQASCIVVTYSRGGALGMAVALVGFALFSRRKARAMVVVTVAVALVVALAPRSFWERTNTIGAYHLDASAMGRIRAWETGFEALREHPVLGIGAGGYLRAWDQYQPRNVRERAYASHNMWMQVAVELGLVGLAAFATMFALMLRGLWRARAVPALESEARALIASFAALLVCGTTGGYAFNWFFYMALGTSGAVVAAMQRTGAARADVVVA
jgi:putative inorganic carbon (HCO3(-)) transporter